MRTQRFLVFGMFVVAFLMSSTAGRAQTAASGPYYATPSWDQKLQCDTPATCPRFVVLSNWNSDAVLDRETGLVWERTPAPADTTSFQWSSSNDYCIELSTGARYGWRLPTIQELLSLRDPSAANAFLLPSGHPFSVSLGHNYFSATTVSTNTAEAWGVNLAGIAPFAKASGGHPWCVRGGQGVDPQ